MTVGYSFPFKEDRNADEEEVDMTIPSTFPAVKFTHAPTALSELQTADDTVGILRMDSGGSVELPQRLPTFF